MGATILPTHAVIIGRLQILTRMGSGGAISTPSRRLARSAGAAAGPAAAGRRGAGAARRACRQGGATSCVLSTDLTISGRRAARRAAWRPWARATSGRAPPAHLLIACYLHLHRGQAHQNRPRRGDRSDRDHVRATPPLLQTPPVLHDLTMRANDSWVQCVQAACAARSWPPPPPAWPPFGAYHVPD